MVPHICDALTAQPISVCTETYGHLAQLDLADASDGNSRIASSHFGGLRLLLGSYYWPNTIWGGWPSCYSVGVSASTPSSPQGKEPRGLLLRQASIWTSTVVSSSNVSLMLAATQARCVLKLFTAASHKPPKCGACSGMKTQSMF